MSKALQFGEQVDQYNILVLNEREIRAAAGILFLATFMGLMLIIFKNNFIPIKYILTFFLTDFIVRVFISPRFSPTLIMGRLIVNKQVPEYVAAKPKRFAWTVGVLLSATMFFFMVVLNSYSPITGIICLICLIFMFFESAFGICLACKFYSFIYKEKTQLCPGEVCDATNRQAIQKTSGLQLLIVGVFIIYIFIAAFVLKENYSKKPYNLFTTSPSEKTNKISSKKI